MKKGLKAIDARGAERLAKSGAVLVDIREDGEYTRSCIPGAIHLPLSRLDDDDLATPQDHAVVFLCASGGRTRIHESRLAEKAGKRPAYVMEGGLAAWHQAGLPTQPGEVGAQKRSGAARGFLARFFAR